MSEPGTFPADPQQFAEGIRENLPALLAAIESDVLAWFPMWARTGEHIGSPGRQRPALIGQWQPQTPATDWLGKPEVVEDMTTWRHSLAAALFGDPKALDAMGRAEHLLIGNNSFPEPRFRIWESLDELNRKTPQEWTPEMFVRAARRETVKVVGQIQERVRADNSAEEAYRASRTGPEGPKVLRVPALRDAPGDETTPEAQTEAARSPAEKRVSVGTLVRPTESAPNAPAQSNPARQGLRGSRR